jgi:hypothetical protein
MFISRTLIGSLTHFAPNSSVTFDTSPEAVSTMQYLLGGDITAKMSGSRQLQQLNQDLSTVRSIVLLDRASAIVFNCIRQHFDRHQPTLDRIDLQPITLQQPHPQQRLCLCCVDFNRSVLPVPDHLCIVNIEQRFTAIAQCGAIAVIPGQIEFPDDVDRQTQKPVKSCINNGINRLVLPPPLTATVITASHR